MMMTASIFLFEMRAAADGKKNGSLFNQEVSLIREAMAKVQQIMPTEIPTVDCGDRRQESSVPIVGIP